MATLNTLEGLADATVVTTANSGGASGDAFSGVSGGANVTARTAAAMTGSRGLRCVSTGATSYVNPSLADGVASSGQWFMDMQFKATVGSVSGRIIVFEDNPGAFQAEIRTVAATNRLELRDFNSITVATTANPGDINGNTFALVLGTGFRVGMAILVFSATVGQIEMMVWDAAGTLVDRWRSAATLDTLRGGGAGRIRVGVAQGVSRTVEMDNIETSTVNYPFLIVNQTVTSGGGIASAEAFGAGTLIPGGVNLVSGGGIASAEAFGPGTLVPGGVTLTSGGGIPSAEAFGPGTLVPGAATVTSGGGIPSGEAFGPGTLLAGGVTLVSGGGIPSGEAFGPGTLIPGGTTVVSGGGIASQETFGPGIVSGTGGGPQNLISGGGITSGEAFGAGTMLAGGVVLVAADGIASLEAFGAGTLLAGAVALVSPGGIPSGEAFGLGSVLGEGQPQFLIAPQGIPSQEQFGAGLVAIMSSGGASQVAPCSWNIDATCSPDWLTFSSDIRDRATRWATEILWMLSGRQFGTCEVTVRPCSTCSPTSYEEWGVILQGYNNGPLYVPYIWNGAWRNCGCPSLCACGATSEVWLPGPIAAIVEVRVDGVVVPTTAYRVDNGAYLVRQDGGVWPETQNYDVAAGEDDTFTVTYLRGTPVPYTGEVAAGALAYEFARACIGADCRLPAQVASIIRQGVEMELVQDDDTGWLTGVKEADMFLRAVNPRKLAQRPRVVSLDLAVPRQTTWGA